MDKKVVLMILDGWGIATDPKVSAIDQANTLVYRQLLATYPHSKLEASGLAVGLPSGQIGNSEVGHMNIGAGRVVYQMLVRINKDVEEGKLGLNDELIASFNYAKEKDVKVHLIGLVSDGGVHSHIDHLKGLLTAANNHGLEKVFIHAFTDGRDCDPHSGLGFIAETEKHCQATTGKIATVIGRYYSMDRDNRWERIAEAYHLLVNGKGTPFKSALEGIQVSYDAGISDEFIKPIAIVDEEGNAFATIEPDDVVIYFNFRTDRGRELTIALSQEDHPEHHMHALPLYYVTMSSYDDTFKNVQILYHKDSLENTLGEVLSKHGKKQLRIAETEKYPHVTFFFSGGREAPFDGEQRILAPSPKVATYDLKPEMSAFDIKDRLVPELYKKELDFVCLNFANADMVGHTGVFEAAVKACEAVDTCMGNVVDAALENDYCLIIIADHGNSDIMINPDGSPNTAHTTNLVPCIMVDKSERIPIKNGKLGDLAPTILTLMGLPIPPEMTGEVLI
ncbi:MAG: 2,3-bisphosphoglycerate-independent phosphoglycerate mutase [Chitinophagales bacterium]|nr:2,3-bisphosphoglycerate-independent phosphoglycerate mutase [Chitinophagales bacterium]